VAVTGARLSQGRANHKPTNCVCERIGWGGSGDVVFGCRAVVFVTENKTDGMELDLVTTHIRN
jgi:hypothetical protein